MTNSIAIRVRPHQALDLGYLLRIFLQRNVPHPHGESQHDGKGETAGQEDQRSV